MKAVLISEQAALTARWNDAFPTGKATGSLKQALRIPKKQDPLYWLDLSSLPQGDWLDAVGALSDRGKVVVLSAKPIPGGGLEVYSGRRNGVLPSGRAC